MGALQDRLGLRSWASCPVRDLERLQAPGANLLCNGMIPLSRRTMIEIMEYSSSLPTGTREGKVWKAWRAGHWWLGRYGPPYPEGHEFYGEIPIEWYSVRVEGTEASWPRDVRVPLRRIR